MPSVAVQVAQSLTLEQSSGHPSNMNRQQRPTVPLAVREAVEHFLPRRGFAIYPRRDTEFSFIFEWGVRVVLKQNGDKGEEESKQEEDRHDVDMARDDPPDEEMTDENQPSSDADRPAQAQHRKKPFVGWICLASASCRQNLKPIAMPRGFTSKACEHLKRVHGLVSNKTQAEWVKKRKVEDEFESLRSSQLYRDNPARLLLLLETRRVVFHSMPFQFAEYTETLLLNQLTRKTDFQDKISINDIRHTIVEMYASTKKEVKHFLKENKVLPKRSLSLVVDFWASPVKKSKYLGLRVYLIDKNWEYRSVLLGTREFNPTYGERDRGLRGPFQRWIDETLQDFDLTRDDFFSSTTDGAGEMFRMMQETFKLQWQWCIPHLSNAATKAACGMHKSKDARLQNPEMTELVRRMARTVYIVNTMTKMGTLWEDLCQMLGRDYRPPRRAHDGDVDVDEEEKEEDNESNDESDTDDSVYVENMKGRDAASHRINKATKLLTFQAHRFMGLVRVIQRLLDRWAELKEFFEEIEKKAAREGKACPYEFPLKKHNKVLVQLLSLLQPVARLNRMAQGERVNQIEVLLELYMLLLDVLDPSKPLPHYLSTPKKPRFISVDDLKPMIRKTRQLLLQGFEKRFFHRYLIFDKTQLRKTPFVPEIQLFLHPRYKHWEVSFEMVIRTCAIRAGKEPWQVERHVKDVSDHVKSRVKMLMTSVLTYSTESAASRDGTASAGSWAPESTEDATSERYDRFALPSTGATSTARAELNRVEDEFNKWMDDVGQLRRISMTKFEPLLHFWRRKSKEAGYDLLPKLVRIVFAAPASSAQLERDFGMSGQMVTRIRNQLSGTIIEMSGFLKANSSFVDITQVAALNKKDASVAKPRVSLVDLNAMINENVDWMLNEGFSSLDVSSEDFSDRYNHEWDF